MDWDKLDQIVRIKQFKWGATLPIAWKSHSLTLKHAADRLYDIYHSASERNVSRALVEFEKDRQGDGDATGSRHLVGEELEDHQDSQLIRIYLLLMGYSIENLLKAIVMRRQPDLLDEASGELKGVKTHDLVTLCSRCSITVSDEDRDLLEKLSRSIVWAGKYPVPLKRCDMPPFKKSDGSLDHQGEAFRGRGQQEEVDQLWVRIWEELEDLQCEKDPSRPRRQA